MADRTADAARLRAALRPDTTALDLSTPRHFHIVGIGGAGMRAIARVLLSLGHDVHGSDRAGSRHIDDLSELGAVVHVGHDGDHVAGADVVTRSTAVPDANPEIEAARVAGIPVLSRAAVLAAISQTRTSIVVAGTHGKTTTSSMLAVLLDAAGHQPSFVIGSDVARFDTGARWTDSTLAVIEGDESDGSFLSLDAAHAIVTSLDPDHLEFYGTSDRLQLAFESFVDHVDGVTAVFADDPDTDALLGRRGVVSYGTAPTADLRIAKVEVRRDDSSFDVWWRGDFLGRVVIALPGRHNIFNAAGALAVALELGITFADAADGLAAFRGVRRRFERRGEAGGVTFIDDYAHLPAEVSTTVATAVSGGWSRVVAVYQPHRYSRTQALGASFGASFDGVDELILTDIYPSGETPRPGVSGRIVYDSVRAASPSLPVTWAKTLGDVANHLSNVLRPGDLCLTLGAGDLTTVPDVVLSRIGSARSPGSGIDRLITRLEGRLEATQVTAFASIGDRTTYRAGGAARLLCEVNSLLDLCVIAEETATSRVDVLIVGRGSNMLISDDGFDGVVVTLGETFEQVHVDRETVAAGGAASLPVVARKTVAAGLTGFEWAVGVPGAVGGAVAMNAGGHGSDMAASLRDVSIVNLANGDVSIRSAADLELAYRFSSLRPPECVVEARFDLDRGDPAVGEQMLSDIVRWRREHQPGGQNAGSVFTNPPNDSAGRLIDAAGCKGMRVGSAEVSTKHANFIQVDPGGSADDVFLLMHRIVARVAEASGVVLEPETRLVGFVPFGSLPKGEWQ